MGGLLDLSGALHPKAYGGYLVGIGTQIIRRNFSQHQCWESRSQNGSVFQTRIRILANKSSVAEPPLFWAAPEVPRSRSRLQIRPNWVCSGSRQKNAAPAPYTKICHFELLKNLLLTQAFIGSYLPLQIIQEQGFPFCLLKKDAAVAGAALQRRLRLRPTKKSAPAPP